VWSQTTHFSRVISPAWKRSML